jgi:hypothetical protein
MMQDDADIRAETYALDALIRETIARGRCGGSTSAADALLFLGNGAFAVNEFVVLVCFGFRFRDFCGQLLSGPTRFLRLFPCSQRGACLVAQNIQAVACSFSYRVNLFSVLLPLSNETLACGL